ncbi:hypothetical protein EXS56_02805 [Candidatus Kaiserbacteria bacterium]|nr:hypothetical protein [Candidatus Kaiserbacteria bacterium]
MLKKTPSTIGARIAILASANDSGLLSALQEKFRSGYQFSSITVLSFLHDGKGGIETSLHDELKDLDVLLIRLCPMSTQLEKAAFALSTCRVVLWCPTHEGALEHLRQWGVERIPFIFTDGIPKTSEGYGDICPKILPVTDAESIYMAALTLTGIALDSPRRSGECGQSGNC